MKLDKLLHFALSFKLVTLIGDIFLAVIVVFLLGLAKELRDCRIKIEGHSKILGFDFQWFNYKDMLANILGIATAILIIIIGG